MTGSHQAVIYFVIHYLSSSLARNTQILFVSIWPTADSLHGGKTLHTSRIPALYLAGTNRHVDNAMAVKAPSLRHLFAALVV